VIYNLYAAFRISQMTTTIIDQTQREQALDPTQSYLVQAPAGSGKTGLLTQRFLRLLGQITHPEEVIALTFTRKAANEMRERIVQALLNAKHHPCPADDDHARTTWQLANTVLQQDAQADWQLLDNPNRLQIMTLDALCARLTRQMPLSTGLGGQTDIADNARELYHQAARQLIMQTQPSCPWYTQLKEVLLHVDNQAERLENLLVNMLACRDQWLPYLLSTSSHRDKRRRLEDGFRHIIGDNMAAIEQAIPDALLIELKELLQFAIQHSTEKNAYLFAYALTDDSLTFEHDTWRAVANWLLTSNNQWRQRVDKRVGFPSPSSNAAQADDWRMMKQRMTQLLETLTDYPDLQQALIDCKLCPPLRYTQTQWSIVDALITLLPLLCAALKLVFQQQHKVDFIEVAAQASAALGELEAPSDLALRLDYKIQHLLVDEFQDTSIQQFHLLEQLTAGWQFDDGRTLFLVGDPMQSIYRFRAAEVGLFLKAKASGIGQLPLTFICLSSNFRSQATLIDWFNHTFAQAFPAQQSIDVGAIGYSAAVATQPIDATRPAVTYHASRELAQQAGQVVSLIQHHQRQSDDISIAILVQSRTQLTAILPALRQANIHYQAVDIDNLRERSVILDLWSLTQSLLLPYNRLAWFSLLRAPWCGLTLADLTLIANYHPEHCLLTTLQDEHCLEQLSPDGARRARYVSQVLDQALQQRQRLPLANWVKATWRRLNGPTCLTQPEQWEEANTFFALLAKFAIAGDLTDIDAFEQELASLYAPPSRHAQVQIMTIHKAKGLEFDVVILPGLAQKPGADKSPLLRWAQRARSSGESDLILAPIKASDAQSDPIVDYLKEQEKRKNEYEAGRLLYVATTRARRQLHLLATLDTDKQGEIKPPMKSSLLHHIWPGVAEAFGQTLPEDAPPAAQSGKTDVSRVIRRLPIDYFHQTAELPPAFEQSETAARTPPVLKFHAQHIGTVIHEQLLVTARQTVSIEDLPGLQNTWRIRLRALGMLDQDIGDAIQTIEQALASCLRDDIGRWILSPRHEQARTEYALTGILDGAYRSIIIDRTFIDEHGVRWIIDYKTVESSSSPEDLSVFLQRQRRKHQQQLDNYARIIGQLGNHPIKCGLYFPQFAGWIDWEYCKHSG
jgi:ATP-dependent helicase/nuclease subunit A